MAHLVQFQDNARVRGVRARLLAVALLRQADISAAHVSVSLSSANGQRQALREHEDVHRRVLALDTDSDPRRVHQHDQLFVHQSKSGRSVHVSNHKSENTIGSSRPKCDRGEQQVQAHALLPVVAVHVRQLVHARRLRYYHHAARLQPACQLCLNSTGRQHTPIHLARPQLLLVGSI